MVSCGDILIFLFLHKEMDLTFTIYRERADRIVSVVIHDMFAL